MWKFSKKEAGGEKFALPSLPYKVKRASHGQTLRRFWRCSNGP